MAALSRPTEATYEVHEKVTVDTSDHEDHTFCGIMFPVKCKDLLPLDHVVIKSISVRGDLGPVTVWVNNEEAVQQRNQGNGRASAASAAAVAASSQSLQHRVRLSPKYWTKLYDQTLKPSPRQYKQLELSKPIKLRPGGIKVIYIHSTLHDDSAIVYDNTPYGRSSPNQYEDDKIAIMSGRAHVSTEVFGQNPIWGYGNAWRDRREFVGRLEYGTVFKLWNPQVQPRFGSNFQDGARSLFLCQRRWESPLSLLPDECIYYILNMCRWDWFDDTSSTMKERRKREKARLKEQNAIELAKRQQEEIAAAVATATATSAVAAVATASEAATTAQQEGEEEEDSKPAARPSTGCCKRRAQPESDDDDDSLMVDAEDDDDVDFVEAYDDDDDNEEDGDDDDDNDNDSDSDNDDDDSDAWSEEEVWADPYHRANVNAFEFRDIDSDQETDDERDAQAAERLNNWRSHFARIHVLRALASMEDTAVVHNF